jgi:hypothetical protein
MTHPDEKRVMRYVKKIAPMQDVIAINLHMADCPECLNKIQSLINARENFDEVMDSFCLDTLETLHREEYLQEALEKVLAETEDQSLKRKIEKWLAGLGQQTGLVFQAFQDSVANLTTIANLKAPGDYNFLLGWKLDYATRSLDSPAGMMVSRASESLKNGDLKGMEDILRKTIKLEPGICENCRISIIQDKRILGFIESDTTQRSIAIFLLAKFMGTGEYLVILIPVDKEETLLIKPLVLTKIDGKEYHTASFSELAGKVYTLIISENLE